MNEIHLLIVWNRHFDIHNSIENFLPTSSKILKKILLTRSEENCFQNFKRFYGKSDQIIHGKINHCGSGDAYLFLIEDSNPYYEKRFTSSGSMLVNVNMFDLKTSIREYLGGGHTIHATNSINEFNKDITLLAGNHGLKLIKQGIAYINKFPNILYDPIGTIKRKSLKLFFEILPYHSDYIVMRNYYDLPKKATYGEHGDIDILVSNFTAAKLLLNGLLVHDFPFRVHYKKEFEPGLIYFDLRSCDDFYYDKKWAVRMIEESIVYNNIRIPNNIDHFHSLIYHALIHKRVISQDYIRQINQLSATFGYDFSSSDFFCHYKNILNKYMNSNGYFYTIPKDFSVFFNFKSVGNDYKRIFLYSYINFILRVLYTIPYMKYIFLILYRKIILVTSFVSQTFAFFLKKGRDLSSVIRIFSKKNVI